MIVSLTCCMYVDCNRNFHHLLRNIKCILCLPIMVLIRIFFNKIIIKSFTLIPQKYNRQLVYVSTLIVLCWRVRQAFTTNGGERLTGEAELFCLSSGMHWLWSMILTLGYTQRSTLPSTSLLVKTSFCHSIHFPIRPCETSPTMNSLFGLFGIFVVGTKLLNVIGRPRFVSFHLLP